MPKRKIKARTLPIILIIDDDPVVVNALNKDLRKYKNKYKIMKVIKDESFNVEHFLEDLKEKNAEIAVFIADQRMPNLTGIEFLSIAKNYFPNSKKCLLTAYDDTNIAISSINDVGLDYFFVKPWTPINEKLHPILDDLLSSWKKQNYAIAFEGIRVVGTKWSKSCHIIKDFLSRNQVTYLWQDMETNADLRVQLEKIDPLFRVPAVFFPDGSHLMNPSTHELAEKLAEIVDDVIINCFCTGFGSGRADYRYASFQQMLSYRFANTTRRTCYQRDIILHRHASSSCCFDSVL